MILRIYALFSFFSFCLLLLHSVRRMRNICDREWKSAEKFFFSLLLFFFFFDLVVAVAVRLTDGMKKLHSVPHTYLIIVIVCDAGKMH